MAYTNFTNCTEEQYTEIIYSQSAKNKIKIVFNNVELENADIYCEKLTRKARIIPDDSAKRLSLDNFVSQELELILHRITDESIIQDQVEISIGTLVSSDSTGDTYEYVPLGVFNIQDTPTTDKDKITIKLRDNRVKFDFNYDAKPLIDNNYILSTDTVYQSGTNYYSYNVSTDTYTLLVAGIDYNIGDTISGSVYIKKISVTKLQIFQDICTQAGVQTDIESFMGDSDEVGIYDNTITATTYISYIAEQSGAIASIDRYGKLIFVYLNDLTTHRIPLSIVEKYEKGDSFTIERIVYEDAVRKFETDTDETLDTLYINSANPYISNQTQIENIFDLLEDFEIDSVSTGKILGNPAIDTYDIIEIYDDYSEEEEQPVIFRTLANHTLKYNGVLIAEYNTQIGLEERKENVTVVGEATFKKWAKAEIDNVNAEMTLQAGQIESTQDSLKNDYYNKSSVDTLVLNAQSGITNTFSEAGGNNIFRNTGLWFEATSTEQSLFPSSETYPSSQTFSGSEVLYEFWNGKAKRIKEEKAVNMNGISLQNGDFYQDQIVPNGEYTISFKYKKLIQLANVTVKINDVTYSLTNTDDTEFVQTIQVNSQHIVVIFTTDIDNSCEIYDLMVNKGATKLAYSQNQNETTTDTVNISKGITITSSDTDVTFKANADGIRTLDKSGNEITKFTDTGMTTKEAIIESKSQIVGTLWQEVGGQTWITRL